MAQAAPRLEACIVPWWLPELWFIIRAPVPRCTCCLETHAFLPIRPCRRGLSPEAAAAFLDSCPPLSFSVWYAGRTDCPAECEARVVLTGADAYTPAHAAAAAGECCIGAGHHAIASAAFPNKAGSTAVHYQGSRSHSSAGSSLTPTSQHHILASPPCRCRSAPGRRRPPAAPPRQLGRAQVGLDHGVRADGQGLLAARDVCAGWLPARRAPRHGGAARARPALLEGPLWRQAGGTQPALHGACRAGGARGTGGVRSCVTNEGAGAAPLGGAAVASPSISPGATAAVARAAQTILSRVVTLALYRRWHVDELMPARIDLLSIALEQVVAQHLQDGPLVGNFVQGRCILLPLFCWLAYLCALVPRHLEAFEALGIARVGM